MNKVIINLYCFSLIFLTQQCILKTFSQKGTELLWVVIKAVSAMREGAPQRKGAARGGGQATNQLTPALLHHHMLAAEATLQST